MIVAQIEHLQLCEILEGPLFHLLHLAADHLEFGQWADFLRERGAQVVGYDEVLDLVLDDAQRSQRGLAMVEDVAPILLAELGLPSAEGLEVELNPVESHVEMVERVVDNREVAPECDAGWEGTVREGVGQNEGGPVVDHRLELDLLPVVLGRPIHESLHERPHRGWVRFNLADALQVGAPAFASVSGWVQVGLETAGHHCFRLAANSLYDSPDIYNLLIAGLSSNLHPGGEKEDHQNAPDCGHGNKWVLI